MQIVIKISEESYKNIKEQVDKRDYPDMQIGRAIANGIQLPEGHGRLIDANKLTESILCKTFGLRSVDIENAPTIIEADKE